MRSASQETLMPSAAVTEFAIFHRVSRLYGEKFPFVSLGKHEIYDQRRHFCSGNCGLFLASAVCFVFF
jgi:hypothetical protein